MEAIASRLEAIATRSEEATWSAGFFHRGSFATLPGPPVEVCAAQRTDGHWEQGPLGGPEASTATGAAGGFGFGSSLGLTVFLGGSLFSGAWAELATCIYKILQVSCSMDLDGP